MESPQSFAEVLDRLTILELKVARIRDPAKVALAEHERGLLQQRWAATGLDRPHFVVELAQVNGLLWQIEDDLRAHERRQDFGEAFITLARSVYRLNDRRAELKQQINRELGSSIEEVKGYG